MRNIWITLSYEGSNYAGFQRQENRMTVQEMVENALQELTGMKTTLYFVARTACFPETSESLKAAKWKKTFPYAGGISERPTAIFFRKNGKPPLSWCAIYGAQERSWTFKG